MGREYGIEHLRDDAVSRLKMELPTKMDQWDRLIGPVEPLELVNGWLVGVEL